MDRMDICVKIVEERSIFSLLGFSVKLRDVQDLFLVMHTRITLGR